MKKQYGVPDVLRLAMHLGKTFMGKQGAFKKHIRHYRLRWLMWAAMMTVSPGVLADQTEYASCLGDRTGSTTNFSYNYWYYGTFYSNNLALPGNYNLTCRPPQGLIVNPGSPPTQPTETPTCTTNILPEDGAGTYYALYRSTNDATGEYCLYSLESDGTNWVSAQLVSAAATPTSSARNIPLLGPLGLIGLLTGLLWFGRKRIH